MRVALIAGTPLYAFVPGVPNHLSHKHATDLVWGAPSHLTYGLVTLSGEVGDRDRSWVYNCSTLGKSWVVCAYDDRVVQ